MKTLILLLFPIFLLAQKPDVVKFNVFSTFFLDGKVELEKRYSEDIRFEDKNKIASIKYIYEESKIVDTVISIFRSDRKLKTTICKTCKNQANNVRYFYDEKGNITKVNWNGNMLFYKNEFDKNGVLKTSKHFDPNLDTEMTQKYKYHKNGKLKEEVCSTSKNEIVRIKYNEKGEIEKEIFTGFINFQPPFINNSTSGMTNRNPFYPNKINLNNISNLSNNRIEIPELVTEYVYQNDVLFSKIDKLGGENRLKMYFYYDLEGYILKIEYKTSANVIFRIDDYIKCN